MEIALPTVEGLKIDPCPILPYSSQGLRVQYMYLGSWGVFIKITPKLLFQCFVCTVCFP